jgi:hypothetical protein
MKKWSEIMTNIYQRINEIQKAVGYVKKDATVGFGNNTYKAVSHDAVLDSLREQLVKHDVVVVPQQRDLGVTLKTGETAKGKDWTLFRALYDIKYVCADNPTDFLIVSVEGHGEDQNDKADGKAITYACKMAHLKLFLLATGINDEERHEEKDVKPKLMKLSAYKKDLESAGTVPAVKDVARRYSKMVDCAVWNKMEIEEASEAYHAKLKEFEGGS